MFNEFACRHLRDLMTDEARCMAMIKECEGLYCDFSRQRATPETVDVSWAFLAAPNAIHAR